jgi:hypothetical protein
MEDYKREDIAKLLGVSCRQVAVFCQSGELPVAHYILRRAGIKPTMFYNKKAIDDWLPNAPKKQEPIYRGKARKARETGKISFIDVFSGKYLPIEERLENFERLVMAQASRPITKTVSFKGVW